MSKSTTTIGRMFRATLVPAGGAALLLAASGASAQRVIEIEPPAPPRAPAPAIAHVGSGNFHGSYTVVNDGDEVRVESNGEKAEVRLNGATLTTLSLSDDWTRYEVQNADGDVVATILRPGTRSRVLTLFAGEAPANASPFGNLRFSTGTGAGTWTFDVDEDEDNPFRLTARVAAAAPTAHPKVMIGVYLGNMDDEAADEAGLDADSVTEISGVVEGGPAAKAGLQSGDIITSIDGSAAAGLSTIQDALRDKNPGDTLALTVLRDGRPQRVDVALEAYSAAAFGGTNWLTPAPPLPPDQVAKQQARVDALAEEIAARSAELGQATGDRARELRAQINELSRQLAALTSRLAQNSFFGYTEPGRVWVDIERAEGAQGGKKIVLYPGAAGQNESFQIQLDDLQARIDDQLTEMDRRLEEMDQRIDRKLDELVNRLLEKFNEQAANPR